MIRPTSKTGRQITGYQRVGSSRGESSGRLETALRGNRGAGTSRAMS